MTTTTTVTAAAGQFPIYLSAGRHLVFDIETVRRLRSELHICGIVVGTLPQISQQSLFLGLPLLLQEDEATLLVERGHAYVVDDVQRHVNFFTQSSQDEVARIVAEKTDAARERACQARDATKRDRIALLRSKNLHDIADKLESASDDALEIGSRIETTTTQINDAAEPIVDTRRHTSRYALFSHLHDRGYYMTPGLRFGGDFVAYPGDPLRFHSHFTCKAKDADEEWSVMDLVSGGRLGTGVKKSWLVGSGEQCFTIEWAGL